MNDVYIKVENVGKTINGHTILKNINLIFEKGKCYALIGRNGSGKSMLLRIITGLSPSSNGVVYVENKKLGKDIDFPKNMTCIIDSPGFLANESGYRNLKYLDGLRHKPRKQEINKVLSDVGLYNHRNKKVSKYSTGMKQRLGLAQVLLEDSELIIFDEPMSGMDSYAIDQFKNILLNIKNNGKTIIITTHMLEDVEMLCDSIFQIENGVIRVIK